VYILGFTGTIYVFQDEIKELFYKERLYVKVPAGASRLPLSQLLPIAEQVMGEGHKISRW